MTNIIQAFCKKPRNLVLNNTLFLFRFLFPLPRLLTGVAILSCHLSVYSLLFYIGTCKGEEKNNKKPKPLLLKLPIFNLTQTLLNTCMVTYLHIFAY